MQGKTARQAWRLALGAVLVAAPALGHHGDAGRYDETPFTITGTVVELHFVNPHSIIVFDVTDETGKTVRWQAELGSPQQLAREFGWTVTTLKPGDRITLTGRRVKSGAPYMNLTERANIVMADTGKEIFRTANYGQPPPPAK